ncbi:MAG: hypothetical protein RBR67_19700 [Desulfobacterium sp.]|nr:hypothetical protein [Desulfobacterium sp.]
MTDTTDTNTDKVDDKTVPVDEPKKTEGNMVPKSRLDQVISQKNEMADTLTGLVDELKADIPEEYQDLIPDTKPQDQIKWIRAATKKGLFTKSKESGPDSKAPKKNKLDFSNMKTSEKIKHGYKH